MSLVSAYVFKHRVGGDALQLAKVGKIDKHQAHSARLLSMATLPKAHSISHSQQRFRNGQHGCFTLCMPDLVVIAVVCAHNYPQEVARRFMSEVYLGFREVVSDPNNEWEEGEHDLDLVGNVFPGMR